jgi:hypothetical protein
MLRRKFLLIPLEVTGCLEEGVVLQIRSLLQVLIHLPLCASASYHPTSVIPKAAHPYMLLRVLLGLKIRSCTRRQVRFCHSQDTRIACRVSPLRVRRVSWLGPTLSVALSGSKPSPTSNDHPSVNHPKPLLTRNLFWHPQRLWRPWSLKNPWPTLK